MAGQIPVIDFQKIDEEPQKMLEASKEWGCFRLINHNVSTELMARMKATAKTLFELQLEMKQSLKEVAPLSGYTGPTETNPYFETFAFVDAVPRCVHDFCSNLQVSPQQRDTLMEYTEATSKLATEVGNKFATFMLGSSYSFDNWDRLFRLNKYTTTRQTIGFAGVQVHTDDGFLTLLQDDEHIGGLEVMDPSGTTYVAVEPVPNAFFVNLGDTSVAWSNGRLRNVKHRVKCKDAGVRISAVIFLSPSRDQIIEPQPILAQLDGLPRYAPLTLRQLGEARASKKWFCGEALELIFRINE